MPFQSFTLPLTQERALEIRREFREEKQLTVGMIPAWRAYRWLKRKKIFHGNLTSVERIRLASWLTRSWVV